MTLTTETETPTEAPPVWSAEEIAQATGKAKSTICRWAELSLLPVIRKFPGKTGVYVLGPTALDEAWKIIEAEAEPW